MTHHIHSPFIQPASPISGCRLFHDGKTRYSNRLQILAVTAKWIKRKSFFLAGREQPTWDRMNLGTRWEENS